MNQFNGLLKKDWKLIKTYVYAALAWNLLMPITSALFGTTFVEGMLLFSAFMMGLHIIMPLLLVAVLLTREMDRLDIFFHSTASIHKLVGSKFLIAIAGTFVSFASATGMAGIALAFAPGRERLWEVLSPGILFALTISVLSVVAAVLFYFFYIIQEILKRRIGPFSYIVTFSLFMLSVTAWTRFQNTQLYTWLTDFWVINLPNSSPSLNYEQSGGLVEVTIGSVPSLPVGEWLLMFLLIAAIYWLASYLFERKVRV